MWLKQHSLKSASLRCRPRALAAAPDLLGRCLDAFLDVGELLLRRLRCRLHDDVIWIHAVDGGNWPRAYGRGDLPLGMRERQAGAEGLEMVRARTRRVCIGDSLVRNPTTGGTGRARVVTPRCSAASNRGALLLRRARVTSARHRSTTIPPQSEHNSEGGNVDGNQRG